MKEKNLTISVIERMNETLNMLNEFNENDEINEAKENLIIDSEELLDNIDGIEREVEKLNEEYETIKENENLREREENIIIENKNNSMKNLKIILGVASLILFSILGIIIYKNIPKSKETEEKVIVADPNNFRISSVKEEDEDEAFNGIEDIKTEEIKPIENDTYSIEEKAEKVNLEKNIDKVEIDSFDFDENRIEKDKEELDRAIAELQNDSNVDVVLGRKNAEDKLAFFRKDVSNDKDKSENYKTKNNVIENKDKDIEINRKNKISSSFNDYIVNQGSLIPAIFLTEVNTDLPGSVLAQVRENIYDSRTGNHLLIPKGSKIYGRYESNISKGQTRVFLVWDKLSLPNGKYIELTEFHTTDNLGNSGVKDKTDNHTWSLIGNAILSSVLNLGDTLANGVSFNVAGVNIGLNGQSKENKEGSPFKEVTSNLVKKEVERQPTITIRRGFKFNIIVNGDLELEKYKY